MDPKALHTKLANAAQRFHSESIGVHGGRDPIAALFAERRAGYSLFELSMSDADCEALRPYLFGHPIPRRAGEAPVACLNLIDGEWKKHRRARPDEVPRRPPGDADGGRPLARSGRGARDRAGVGLLGVARVGEGGARVPKARREERLAALGYFYEECLDELRQQTPKTRLEADKDFWEAKRAADHLEGNAEKAMRGELVPMMVPGQTYWKDSYLPAGVCAVITPMNFIYGIPGSRSSAATCRAHR